MIIKTVAFWNWNPSKSPPECVTFILRQYAFLAAFDWRFPPCHGEAFEKNRTPLISLLSASTRTHKPFCFYSRWIRLAVLNALPLDFSSFFLSFFFVFFATNIDFRNSTGKKPNLSTVNELGSNKKNGPLWQSGGRTRVNETRLWRGSRTTSLSSPRLAISCKQLRKQRTDINEDAP